MSLRLEQQHYKEKAGRKTDTEAAAAQSLQPKRPAVPKQTKLLGRARRTCPSAADTKILNMGAPLKRIPAAAHKEEESDSRQADLLLPSQRASNLFADCF